MPLYVHLALGSGWYVAKHLSHFLIAHVSAAYVSKKMLVCELCPSRSKLTVFTKGLTSKLLNLWYVSKQL